MFRGSQCFQGLFLPCLEQTASVPALLGTSGLSMWRVYQAGGYFVFRLKVECLVDEAAYARKLKLKEDCKIQMFVVFSKKEPENNLLKKYLYL